jgi:hypothetical protein
VEAKKIARQPRKGKKSSVWKLGVELKRVSDDAKFWQCLICKHMKKPTVLAAAATTSSFRHLKAEHGIIERNKRFVLLEQEARTDSPITSSFNSLATGHLFSKSLIDEVRFLFLQWIICCHIALTMVENRFFLSFIRLINLPVLSYLPKSSTTLRKWVINEYQRQKNIKEVVGKSRSRITISFDTWTAPFAKKHVISLIAHFVDEDWK